MTKSKGIKHGKEAQRSAFEINANSARSHVEAGLGAIEEGSPRHLVRFHLREIRRILDRAEHETAIVDGEEKRCAVVPDQELGE